MSDLPQPRQLQVNQSGAWRSVINFDQRTVPPEFFTAADTLARLAGGHIAMRQVRCTGSNDGGTRPTRNVVAHWSKEKGWAQA